MHCSGVTFQLSAGNYTQMEAPNAVMPVIITKDPNVLLANPVTFMVVPLTVDEALSRGVITEFRPLNPLSPNRAGENL